MTQAHPMVRRVAAAQAALDHFRDRPFKWGQADCVRLAAFAVRRLGHSTPLLKAGRYGNEAAAREALKRAGFDTLEQALDAKFFEIPPAAALPADIITVEGKEGGDFWPCLMIAVGNGRTVGFHAGFCRVLQPVKPLRAWRVDPVQLKKARP